MRSSAPLLSLAILGSAAVGCGDNAGDGYEPGEEYAGDVAGTVFDTTRTAFSRMAPAFEGERRDGFFVGNSLFNRNWVTAPSSTEGLDGLGPSYNAVSCSACHFLDGRGHSPDGDEAMLSALVRLSIPGVGEHGGTIDEPTYGGQLNPAGILGVPGEGRATIAWEEVPGTYGDGTAYSLRRPVLAFTELAFGAMADDTLTSLRVAPHMAGLGLLELVPADDVRALADPDDADGDGVSGRTNEVWDVAAQAPALGRFGWKANQPSLRQQTAGAFLGDMGLTTSLFPTQNCPDAQTECLAAPTGAGDDGVEVDDDKLDDMAYYAVTLAAPGRRDVRDPDVLRGKASFEAFGCASCHTPVLHTGDSADYPELSNLTIRPYTDLLVHDLGDDLADGRPDFAADGNEWRTPPLWGIGLFGVVNEHTFYLHDGRARGLAEAVLWHGGEAEAAREAFRAAPADERDALIRFLESL